MALAVPLSTVPVTGDRRLASAPVSASPSSPLPVSTTGASSIGALLDWARARLVSSSGSPRLDAELLLAFVLDRPRSFVVGFPERGVSASETARYRQLVERREAGVPVAYLTGHREFYSLSLAVSSATLVPRPETELLVDKVLERLPADERAVVLDIKHHRPCCRMVAVECSATALEVAVYNGARFGLCVDWIRSDWFSALADGRFDFIAANPPYVNANEEALVSGDLRHEPRVALDGGEDGLRSLREIIEQAPRVLATGGTLLLEHGNDQATTVRTLLRHSGFRGIRTHRDLAGHDRVTLGRLS